ncbi:MAG: hypothetical protein H7X94_08275 [Vallitaleaceae bacterium]|nr:hypothetical protein [Vallitaleaceae bacterium]
MGRSDTDSPQFSNTRTFTESLSYMTPLWYTARKKFNQIHPGPEEWKKYCEWARLPQLREVTGLDSILNGLSFEYDTKDADLYNYLIIDGGCATDLFNSASYVLECVGSVERFNFLAVTKNPASDCSEMLVEGFIFLGYELLDKYYGNSALTNCGGFDETFLPAELNAYGLLTNFERAMEVHEKLFVNTPSEVHADCNLFAVWKHQTIGFDHI